MNISSKKINGFRFFHSNIFDNINKMYSVFNKKHTIFHKGCYDRSVNLLFSRKCSYETTEYVEDQLQKATYSYTPNPVGWKWTKILVVLLNLLNQFVDGED